MRVKAFVIRWTSLVLVPALLLVHLLPVAARSMQEPGEQSAISNVSWKLEGEQITISYDLAGSRDDTYEISVVMLREDDPAFRVVPQSIDGDVGLGRFAGKNRKIIWSIRRDFPAGFQGEGYYFEIQARPASGDSRWLYYAIGGAALVGGIVAILVSSRQSDKQDNSLPLPPGRP